MPLMRLAKLEPRYLLSWREANRQKARKIRGQVLESVHNGTSLTPAITEQQEFVVNGIHQAFAEIGAPSLSILEPATIGLVAGSYARKTCVVGSDLDFDLFYPEEQRKVFFSFERAIVSAIEFVFDFPQGSIHPHLAPIVGYVGKIVDGKKYRPVLSKLLQWGTKFKGEVDPEFNGIGGAFSKYLVGIRRQYANRDFTRFSSFCLEKAKGRIVMMKVEGPERSQVGMNNFDLEANLRFVAGNEGAFDQFLNARKDAYQKLLEPRLEKNIEILKTGCQKSLLNQQEENPFKESKSIKEILEKLKRNSLIHHYYLRALEMAFDVDLLGVDRVFAEGMSEALLTFKALINIESDPFDHISTPFQKVRPLDQSLLERVALHLGESSSKGLVLQVNKIACTLTEIVENAFNTAFPKILQRKAEQIR